MTSVFDRYFRPKAFELDGRLYRWCGVVPFKRGLMSLLKPDPSRPTANAYVLGGRSLEAVRAWEKKSHRSEVIHLFGLLLALALLGLGLWTRSGWQWIPGLTIFAVNFHCFILQRYNRIRVYRLLDKARRHGRAGP